MLFGSRFDMTEYVPKIIIFPTIILIILWVFNMSRYGFAHNDFGEKIYDYWKKYPPINKLGYVMIAIVLFSPFFLFVGFMIYLTIK